ncbi:Alkaline-phosphatase-like, core domain containing protein [Elaphomyces granulatus]
MPASLNLPGSYLLSPAAYDDDVRSLSEQDSDSEDDELVRGSRSTLELAKHDRTVLEEEEEREKLLTKSSPADGLRRIFSPNGGNIMIGRRERRKRRKERRAAQRRARKKPYVEDDLMYEMKESDNGNASTRSSTPSELDSRVLDESQSKGIPTGRMIPTLFGLAIFLSILFLIILLGAYKASSTYRIVHQQRLLKSNGTALFPPTTILISLDGFRADFLNRGLTPTLNSFIAQGVSPAYLLPSFPSVTFPNHFTLVTGLYPESHGIVGNSFWDPSFNEEFVVSPSVVTQSKWWNAEPLWVTAEKQGIRTAIHMWPGSEANISGVAPTFVDKYNGTEALPRKVDRVLEFLDLPGEENKSESKRPQFIAAYVPNIDSDGHKYGPNSTEIRNTISEVDGMLANLFKGLQERNLTGIVNIIVVSDHGMATTSSHRLVQLEDLVDLYFVEHIDGWPLRGLRPKQPEHLSILQTQLVEGAQNFSDAIEIYSRQTMPERYHFSNNERIAPLWIIPKTGWAVVEKSDFDAKEGLKEGKTYHPRGIHGYDHEHPLMRAIFVARGPAFPHEPNSRLNTFQNTEVYNILCDSLGIVPRPNNGTLRLPLRPIGLHSEHDASSLDSPEDPPGTPVTISETSTTTPPPQVESSSKADKADSWPSRWINKLIGVLESFDKWLGNLFN